MKGRDFWVTTMPKEEGNIKMGIIVRGYDLYNSEHNPVTGSCDHNTEYAWAAHISAC